METPSGAQGGRKTWVCGQTPQNRVNEQFSPLLLKALCLKDHMAGLVVVEWGLIVSSRSLPYTKILGLLGAGTCIN